DKLREWVRVKKAFLPLDLYQDDGYSVRVQMQPLTPQEEQEWVARARWYLDLSQGKMVISGIADEEEDAFLTLPIAADSAEVGGAFQCYVEVPPGLYQVEIYSFAPGDLSTAWQQITGDGFFPTSPGIEPELLPDYFKRTRPGQEAPPWIALELTEDSQVKQQCYEQLRDLDYLNFIIRLTPELEDLPTVEINENASVQWELRKPALCPLGILKNLE
ncbi:MAG: hypothetical protein ACKO5Q_11150, partial [Microcystaceae cyanobacterium]